MGGVSNARLVCPTDPVENNRVSTVNRWSQCEHCQTALWLCDFKVRVK